MKLQPLPYNFTVCKIPSLQDADLSAGLFFLGRTDEELSLVCETAHVPAGTAEREDGWRGFRVQGTLDFSLTGILSGLSSVLAEHSIGIFAVSTFNTDYIFVKQENFNRALRVLSDAGYEIGKEAAL